MRVAVIGAGPSGLVTLKYLLQAPGFLECAEVDACLFECDSQIGGTFAARAYEDAELVSSRQLTTFSDFRKPAAPDFLTAKQYVEYLEDYCDHFQLWGRIKLNAKVTQVVRKFDGHEITYEQGGKSLTWQCDAVAVCSGLHVLPHRPAIDGIQHTPRVIHSSQFKSRAQFTDCRNIMIVGAGETGADISHLAITTPTVERVVLCHKDGFHFAPKRNPGPVILPILGRVPSQDEPGIPIDVSRANLFDTAYVHTILRQNDKLLWDYYSFYIKCLLYISSGTTAGMDQWIGGVSPERNHPSKLFFNKSMAACPYISYNYRPQLPGKRLWAYALRSALFQTPVGDTGGKFIDLAPMPEKVHKDGHVQFLDNGRPEYDRMKCQTFRPDLIVLCTGYTQSFPFLSTDYPTPSDANVRNIWRCDDPSVGFIGFVRPSLGAIPPLAEMQAQLWVTQVLAPGRIASPLRPEDEWHYRLRSSPSARVRYGVDHESYAYQLALDLDAATGLCEALASFRRLKLGMFARFMIMWAFGANLNTKFRLKGPWRWEKADDLFVSDEFWETITRRPILFGHVAVSIIPMCIFGPISLFCFLYSKLQCTITKVTQRNSRKQVSSSTGSYGRS